MTAARWLVCVIGGPANGRKLALAAGEQLTVGRAPGCGLSIDDAAMAGEHCTLAYDGERLLLHSYDSESGTLLQGEAIKAEAELKHGDWVRAGHSELVLYEEDRTGRLLRAAQPASEARETALSALQAELPLYALVDVARDVTALQLLRETMAEVRCLLDEPQATELAYVAPYLVALHSGDTLLDALVELGWGNSWCVYLRYARPPVRLRAQLLKSLNSTNPESGAPAYFRFYDPRVLRTHLPQCSARQRALLFGDIEAFFAEGEDGSLLRFDP